MISSLDKSDLKALDGITNEQGTEHYVNLLFGAKLGFPDQQET